MRINIKIFFYLIVMLILSNSSLFGQLGELRWIRISNLHNYFSEQGTDFEDGRPSRTYVTPSDGMIWPGDYGEIQQTNCAHGFWVGAKNVYHPVEDKTYPVRVVGRGPRNHTGWQYELFPVEHKMIARFERPTILVNGVGATDLDEWDEVDEIDPNIPCDRMIITKFNTLIGLTVTKKIMAYSHYPHNNYFIFECTLENTGIYDEAGNIYEQTLNDVYMYSHFRYAFAGESCTGYDEGWGEWDATWGKNTINHAFGPDFGRTPEDIRAFFAFYGPMSVRGEWDWGNPNETADPTDNILDEDMAAAKFAGAITLHADKSPSDTTDWTAQPITTNYVDSDDDITQAVTAFNETRMQARYDFMKSGHPANTQWEDLQDAGEPYYADFGPAGGYAQGLGYGPYTLAPGEKIKIVIAEGVHGLNREKNREVTKNWLMHYLGLGTPTLTLPDGGTAATPADYLQAWVMTCQDSIMKTFYAAKDAYDNNYHVPIPPPPPSEFNVDGGGDRINISWSNNAEGWTNSDGYSFDGYQIWRAENNIGNPQTKYRKVFECDGANAVTQYGDTAVVGNNYYYYYLQTKATNGSGNTILSSKFYTITNTPAELLRPAGQALADIRVVPNPFIIGNNDAQFPNDDEIRFYEIPAFCKIKIFTERGDLVWENDHDTSSGKETWYSLTSAGQILTTGIYIAYFEVTKDYPENAEGVLPSDTTYVQPFYRRGESTYRKFIVIR